MRHSWPARMLMRRVSQRNESNLAVKRGTNGSNAWWLHVTLRGQYTIPCCQHYVHGFPRNCKHFGAALKMLLKGCLQFGQLGHGEIMVMMDFDEGVTDRGQDIVTKG